MAADLDGEVCSVPIPAELDAEVRRRMQAGRFGSLSEYVRTTIRADLQRAQQEALERSYSEPSIAATSKP